MKFSKGLDQFVRDRYGLFIHYGLYSLAGRAEWYWNREAVDRDDYTRMANSFTAEHFDADEICGLAKRCGMQYVVLTTMHHDGFRLYQTDLSDFCAPKMACGRDLVAEFVAAARRHELRIGLYHSLNNWHDQPDAVAALENRDAYEAFMENTFARVEELVKRFMPFDIFWYDGWWPFNAEGWQAEAMNARIRTLMPNVIFNGRNGLPGDFATPEGHMSAPHPWRPWEACMTMNNSWGYHAGDHDWKSPQEIVDLLTQAAIGKGNLLLNIGPRGDGVVPEPSVNVIETVGAWLNRGGREALFDTDLFTYDLQMRGNHRSDWSHHGQFTAKGNDLYWLVRRWPGSEFGFNGLETKVERVDLIVPEHKPVEFDYKDGRLVLLGLPETSPDSLCAVFRIKCESEPHIYLTGGLREPCVDHPRYDPCPSDIQH